MLIPEQFLVAFLLSIFSSHHTIPFFVVTELVNENLPVVELENQVQFGAETEKKIDL